ncbi:ABC transporter substrate-binding protein [Tropicimonas sp. IMCC34011]|uniref:ABC transporter substrate-binding protein n=1 Tax=Tropicimonas sp. IMCC34011 TaxID=2248759 RepID=UPI000E221F26|nr:ABC transporter substrate-binding protein [Tropicimonas sp. IMCC34011]
MTNALLSRTALAAIFLAGFSAAGSAQDLSIALADDPDALDPVTNRTHVGITVMGVMCDGLLTTDEDLNFVPVLAESWSWSDDGLALTMNLRQDVTFQDGTPFNADAVKAGLERALNQPDSQRAADISSISSVEAPGEYEVVVNVSEPSAQLLSKFAERVGIIFSPTAIEETGAADIGAAPVCAGPYAFDERVAQDRIVVKKVEDYWNADAYAFDTVTFRVMPDDSVRLANLQSGDVDIMEKLDPSNVDVVEQDPNITVEPVAVMNNQALMYNLEQDGPFASADVRNAFELSLDRNAINQVAFGGRYLAGNQVTPPNSQYYDPATPMPERDVEGAKALLEQAGVEMPVEFEILVPNRPLSVRVAQMMQAMSQEAGFATELNVVDFATTLQMTEDGNFTAWGPIGPQFANDPDAVAFQVLHSTGSRNLSRYYSDEMDALLEETRTQTDPAERVEVFHKVAALAAADEPVTYLYHMPQIYAYDSAIEGLTYTGDGFLRLVDVTRAE